MHSASFPGSVPDFVRASRGGTLLDAVPALTADEIYRRLSSYGPEGRQNYAFRNRTVDVLLPFSVLPFLWLLARRAVNNWSEHRVLALAVLSMPFVYVGFDLIENATVLRLLARYPDRLDGLASTLPFTTIIKRAASVLAIAVPLLILVGQALRRRNLKRAD